MFKISSRHVIALFYAVILSSPMLVNASPKQDPLAHTPEYKEAYARLDAKDYKGTINILQQLLKKSEESAGLYYALGKALQELGDNKNALYNYDKSIEFDSRNPKAFSNRGLVYGATGNLKMAVADFTKAIAINPRYDHAYSNRGVARGALGDMKGAIADFTKAISINPRFSSAWRNRGITREMSGDLNGACNDWHQAAKLGQADVSGWVKDQCKGTLSRP